MRRPSGFTLVELLVTLAISGLLLGLLIPAVQKTRESAKRRTVWCDFAKFDVASQQYRATTGRPPFRLSTIEADVARNAAGEYVDPWQTPYRATFVYALTIQVDSQGRHVVPANHYTISGQRPRFVAFQFISAGPDRQFTGYGEWDSCSDDIANFITK